MTEDELRHTVALDAQRFYRKAARMQAELERGVADECFDRMELLRSMERASRYAKAVVVALSWSSGGHPLEALIGEVVQTGELQHDRQLLDVLSGLDSD